MTKKLSARRGGTLRWLVTTSVAGVLVLAAFGGVALAEVERGTPGNDFIIGTQEADRLYGLGGNDIIVGRARNDELYGGEGNDEAYGGRDADLLHGGEGTDILDGGRGTDVLRGGMNGDYLFDGGQRLFEGPRAEESKDVLGGEEGDDFLYVRNRPASKDVVYCGSGTDAVVADAADRVPSDCEEVHRR